MKGKRVSCSGSVAAEPAQPWVVTPLPVSHPLFSVLKRRKGPYTDCSYLHLQTPKPPPQPQREERASNRLHRFLLRKQSLNIQNV
ncbi:hypothetical protein NDU88_007696 [Pleurodeles waltl]|uniref:Uncharacterized protein n=1 Tax=Pleurodeles waltl TaxID=8319 RepID=A0AAV7STJ7_PLEWA|nr:hypothetical protein NDU88_007696 [Pleurodeles waltl]